MNNTDELFRSIPNVDRLLRHPVLDGCTLPRAVVVDAVRRRLEALRVQILSGGATSIPCDEVLCRAALSDAHSEHMAGIRPVINGTGVILHSNLGRACLSKKAVEATIQAAGGFSTLEYDLDAGERGSRTKTVEAQLIRLTGAESALVVNNNAAAVLLILSTMAAGGSVIVSRGELVEIGGSFRIPEIMEQCGCRLHEVGTTNKTRIEDYETAIDDTTRALLKVHTSNFKIVGFSDSVTVKALSALGQQYELPVIEDIGSGALVRMERYGLQDEPFASDSLSAGADIVSFSGDKLLCGPQAGIILGKEKYISMMKKHPLYRALRVSKLILAPLEETLRSYSDPLQAQRELPLFMMLSAAPETLRNKADKLCRLIADKGVAAEVVPVYSTVGSGSVPGSELPSFAVRLRPDELGATALDMRLRTAKPPVIGRIVKDQYLLDVRTIFDEELNRAAQAIVHACTSEAQQ